jgi:hypothetical protein
MPTLTRRRDPGASHETWLIFYGDVNVGTIAMGSGNASGGDQWTWHCGFYPGSNPGDATNGTATTFDAARAAFESAWSVFLSKRTEADFLEYRRHRASNAWKYVGGALQTPDQTALLFVAPVSGSRIPAHLHSSHEPEPADHFLSRSRGDRLRSDR